MYMYVYTLSSCTGSLTGQQLARDTEYRYIHHHCIRNQPSPVGTGPLHQNICRYTG